MRKFILNIHQQSIISYMLKIRFKSVETYYLSDERIFPVSQIDNQLAR